MKSMILYTCLLLSSAAAAQPSVLGKWKSVDENSGEAKSVVELTERNGKVFGKIIRIFPKAGEDPDPVCDKCPDDDSRFNQKVVGMEIITEMTAEDGAWSGGKILDPEAGKLYSCKLWLDKNALKVRGYIGPFYRTQTWVRVQ